MNFLHVYTLPKYNIIYDVVFHDGNEKRPVNKRGEKLTRLNAEKLTGILSEYDQRVDGYNDTSKADKFNPAKPKLRVGKWKYRYLTKNLEDMEFCEITDPHFGDFQTSTGINLSAVGHNIDFAKETLTSGKRIEFTANVIGSDSIVIDRCFAIVEYDECTILMGKQANYRINNA